MKSSSARVLVLASAAFALPAANASLLLYEGFNGYTAGTQAPSLTPNGNTVGVSGSYANGATDGMGNSVNVASMMVTSNTGISFGSLQTSGGSLTIGSGTGVAQTAITTTTSSSVIWSSYLVNLSSNNSTGASNGFEVRLNTNVNSNSGNAYFRSNADSRGETSVNPAVGYDGTLGAAGNAPLTLNTNYIVISKLDTGAGGGSTLWALDVGQFESFVAAGRTEAFLANAGNVTATATDAQPAGSPLGWNSPGTPSYLEFVTSGVGGRLDEIRYGETLLDVTPVIPEPSAILLLSLAGAAGVCRRGR